MNVLFRGMLAAKLHRFVGLTPNTVHISKLVVRLPKQLRLLLFGSNYVEIDLRGSFYEIAPRLSPRLSPDLMPLPPITVLRQIMPSKAKGQSSSSSGTSCNKLFVTEFHSSLLERLRQLVVTSSW